MILIDSLKVHHDMGAMWDELMDDNAVTLRVHRDVLKLAAELADRDADKLLATDMTRFMPAARCWFEFEDGEGRAGFYFQGDMDSVTHGDGVFVGQRYREEEPTMIPITWDLETGALRGGYSHRFRSKMRAAGRPFPDVADPLAYNMAVHRLRPLAFAILALINSPKIVRRDPARLERLNRKRQAVGRYTFHPHHVVSLNVDKRSIRVGASAGGDGASRALHFVRSHLRLVDGRYVLVRPHWRGDAAIGIVKPGYEIERENSRW